MVCRNTHAEFETLDLCNHEMYAEERNNVEETKKKVHWPHDPFTKYQINSYIMLGV